MPKVGRRLSPSTRFRTGPRTTPGDSGAISQPEEIEVERIPIEELEASYPTDGQASDALAAIDKLLRVLDEGLVKMRRNITALSNNYLDVEGASIRDMEVEASRLESRITSLRQKRERLFSHFRTLWSQMRRERG